VFLLYSWQANPYYALNYVEFYNGGGFEQPIPAQPGLMHTTAFGEGPEHCVVNTFFQVTCYDEAGNEAELADYTVAVHENSVANAGRVGAWLSFDDASPAGATYPFFPDEQFGTPTESRVERLGRGSYRAFLPGMPASDKAVPMVTALDIVDGERAAHCKPETWFPTEGETAVDVNCYKVGGDADGESIDSQFNLSYLTNR
jgi:hypothetical protein